MASDHARLVTTSIVAASAVAAATLFLIATAVQLESRTNLFLINNASPSLSNKGKKRTIKKKRRRRKVVDTDSESSSEDEDSDDENGEKRNRVGEGEDGKPYEVKKEFYSTEKGTWKAIDEKDEDDDEDERSKFLFVVRQRSWPKSADYINYEDYTNLEIHSTHLIDFLRSVQALQEVEEVHEDKPEVEEKDLYLVREELREALNKRKELLSTKKSEGSSSSSETDSFSTEEEDNLSHSEKKSTAEEKSEEELKVEIEHVEVLLKYLEDAFASTTTKLARLLQLPHSSKPTDVHSHHAQISYNLLWAIFPPNSLVSATDDLSGEKYAFKVKTAVCKASETCDRNDGAVFSVSGYALLWNGTKYARVIRSEKIPKFKALRRLSTLATVPLKPGSKLYQELETRGKSYLSLSGSPKFLYYNGVLTQIIGFGSNKKINKMRAEGRAVVDAKSFRRMNPMREMDLCSDDDSDYFLDYDSDIDYEETSLALKQDITSTSTGSTVSPSDYVLLPPTVFAFSLALREWGDMSVEGFSEIEFRNDAWDRLVIDKDYKELIRSLVGQNTANANQIIGKGKSAVGEVEAEAEEKKGDDLGDIVEGKGGGLVIALHGLPGVGKTLTAEAVAESLQVPLYTVGAGSLGVTADVLEKRLRDILDIASAWGATLLIDEADVFLEARAKHDINRNALVSVFLRLLEYHQGVLFLTTNRIRSIDEAFLSRFSLAITYPNLDAVRRRIIWCDFLEHAGVGIKGTTIAPKSQGIEKVDKLAKKKDFNGRIIKNIVRTAQSLSRSQGVPLTERHLNVVIKANEEFVRDYKEADEMGIYEVQGEGWKDHTNVYG
ncbi:hypothetical protein JCM3765_007185 [Sporobolomyces pararoseus]